MTDAAGSRLRVLAHDAVGTGPVILFVHAFPLNRRMWRPQVDRLRGEARVIAVDLPGFGQSPPGSTASIPGFADAVVAVLDQYEIPRAAVVGCSMGGYVAQSLAVRHPDRVAALGLADTRARADTPQVRAGREALITLVREQGMTPVPDRQLPKLLSRHGLATPAHVALVRELIAEGTPEGLIAAAQAMAARPDFTPLLNRITCPAVVIVGTEDAIIPVEEARSVATDLPRGRFVPIEGAGHLANLEAPDEFTAAVRGLLEEVARR